jgi:CMP-N-acetylneuraminic acid synthetase
MKILGLITARGGSKGIPRKAVAPLSGKPLIAWTIEAAHKSKHISRVIVSTDDKEIAETSRNFGAEVPFIRPAELAQDDSPHIDVVLHALKWLEDNENWRCEYIMLLQPTSPLRTAEDIDNAVDLALDKKADAVTGVCKAERHPYLARIVDANGVLSDFMETPEGYLQRQKMPLIYFLNGAIFLVRCEILLAEKTLQPDGTLPYIMPPERSIDIDEEWDMKLAELILGDRMRS